LCKTNDCSVTQRPKGEKRKTISNYSKKKYNIAENPRFMERPFTDRRKAQLNSYNSHVASN
jgi:hypothetical protein